MEIDKKSKILVAVSGGVDSVYMLHKLVCDGYSNLAVAHFDHMIREDSTNDVLLVQDLTVSYDLRGYFCCQDIPNLSKDRKQSIELVARKARREFFMNTMNDNEYEWLALGQHADDQAETVFYNFIRGTGVHGLAAMKRIDDEQQIFRPLFDLTKKEIYERAKRLNLKWIEDETNHGYDNERSWIRNKILPELETHRAGVRKVLTDTASRFQELSDYLKIEAKRYIKHWNRFDVDEFKTLPYLLQGEVLGLYWEYHNGSRTNFKQSVVTEVTKWLNGDPKPNSHVYFGDKELWFNKNTISIS